MVPLTISMTCTLPCSGSLFLQVRVRSKGKEETSDLWKTKPYVLQSPREVVCGSVHCTDKMCLLQLTELEACFSSKTLHCGLAQIQYCSKYFFTSVDSMWKKVLFNLFIITVGYALSLTLLNEEYYCSKMSR